MSDVLVLATPIEPLRVLADGLDAPLVEVPEPSVPDDGDLAWRWSDELDRWRDGTTERSADRVVVAAWGLAAPEPADLDDVDLHRWRVRAELPLARWFAAMGAATRACRDGGAVVALVERPPALDCAGWAPEAGVADAVEAMVRSLARAEGPRGVRVNAATTPIRLARPPVVDPAPSLPSFPGTIEVEALGAVRLLLSPDAVGITGSVVDADCGRSWRS